MRYTHLEDMGQSMCALSGADDNYTDYTVTLKACVIFVDDDKLAGVVARIGSMSLTGCSVSGIRCDESSVRFSIGVPASSMCASFLGNLHSELAGFFDDAIYVEMGSTYRMFDPVRILNDRAKWATTPAPRVSSIFKRERPATTTV